MFPIVPPLPIGCCTMRKCLLSTCFVHLFVSEISDKEFKSWLEEPNENEPYSPPESIHFFDDMIFETTKSLTAMQEKNERFFCDGLWTSFTQRELNQALDIVYAKAIKLVPQRLRIMVLKIGGGRKGKILTEVQAMALFLQKHKEKLQHVNEDDSKLTDEELAVPATQTFSFYRESFPGAGFTVRIMQLNPGMGVIYESVKGKGAYRVAIADGGTVCLFHPLPKWQRLQKFKDTKVYGGFGSDLVKIDTSLRDQHLVKGSHHTGANCNLYYGTATGFLFES